MASKKMNDTLAQFLSGLGVDNPQEVLKDPLKRGLELNKQIAMGRNAIGKLQGMQARDAEKELESVGITKDQYTATYDTIEEFKGTTPIFVCAESIFDQKLKQWDGAVTRLSAGDNICMTASSYANNINQNPTIKLSKKSFKDTYKPYNGENLDGKTLFIWRSGGIGDLLFIRTVMMNFKAKYDVKIILATRERYHSMVEQWEDCIDVLHSYPFNVDNTLEAADYHIAFEGVIERCGDAERMDVHDLFAKRACIELEKYNFPMKCVCQNSFFDLNRGDYAVVQVSASSPIRTPFTGKMVDVVNHLTKTMNVIISDSARNQRNVDDFISCCKDQDKIINFARYTGSVVDAVKLVTGAKIVVAPDSSHVHMAAHQGVPCVGLYGPFPAKVRTAHYDKFIGVEPEESDACTYGGKECYLHAHLPCKYKTKCWHQLDTKKVITAIKELLK